MLRPRIYVTGPLTEASNPWQHVRTAAELARQLMLCGYAPFVPHLSWFLHSLDESFDHFSNTAWTEAQLPWVIGSRAVLRFPGASVGADAVEQLARNHCILVCHTLADLLQQVPLPLGETHVESANSSRNAPGP